MDNPLFDKDFEGESGDGYYYDEFGVAQPIQKFNADPTVWDKDWGWRRQSWLDKKRKKHFSGYKDAFQETSETYRTYDYGWGQKVSKDDNVSAYDDYQKTGVWKGYDYYKPSTIDYRYIEQMANYFSAEHNVTVTSGETWAIDLKTKTLEYNPTDLMFGTKANVVVSLLHEIGHLRHTAHPDDMKQGKYLTQYGENAFGILNLYEDFRIDELMKKSYAGAEDIYEANVDTVKRIVEIYKNRSENMKRDSDRQVDWLTYKFAQYRVDKDRKCLEEELIDSSFDISDGKIMALADELLPLSKSQFESRIKELKGKINADGNVYDYNVGIIGEAYGIKYSRLPADIERMVQGTKQFINPIKKAKSTQEVEDILEKDVFPIIEDLLKQEKEGGKGAQEVLGSGAKGISRSGLRKEQVTREGEANGGNNDTLPQQWKDGDYGALKESVDSAIRELARKMKILKVNDTIPRFETKLRRGRIDIKRVYRFPSDNFDFFKRKKTVIDRTRNFAFTLLTDTSGSMDGKRAIHATRGAIMLAEVFKQFEIPFEIINFGSFGYSIKKFDDKLDEAKKKKLAECVHANDGSTRLSRGLEISKLAERPERNKYCIVITDGGLSDFPESKLSFEKMRKSGVQGIGINISGTRQSGLIEVLGKNVSSFSEANKLPTVFEELMKEAIKKAK